MPPARHNPSQRVHDRVNPTGTGTLQPTAESFSPSGSAPRNPFKNRHLSSVWNGHSVTPAAHYLLIHGVDPSVVHHFSPIIVHNSSHIFDPSSSLPIPPNPDTSSIRDSSTSTHLTRQVTGVPSDPSASSSSSPFTTSSLAIAPPISKSYPYPSAPLPATANASLAVCTDDSSVQPARPSNNFVLFRVDYFARVKSLHLSSNCYASLPKVNRIWNQAPDAVKTYYHELALLTKEVHGRLHPGYKYKPRKKDEKQRQTDEKARIKREMMVKAKANKVANAKAKSPTAPPAANTVSVPKTPIAVDVRMYEPASRTYHRVHPSEPRSPPLPLPLGAPPSRASSPSPVRSGVRNTAQLQDTDHHSSSSPLRTISPAITLFQSNWTESPRFEDVYCTMDDSNELGVTGDIRPTIEDDVELYQAAPPHWCRPDDHLQFCDDAETRDNCMAMSWSDELNFDTTTAVAMPHKYNFAGPSHSVAVYPIVHAPSLPTCSAASSNSVDNYPGALLASSMEADGDGELSRLWNGSFAMVVHGQPPLPSDYPAPSTVYTCCA